MNEPEPRDEAPHESGAEHAGEAGAGRPGTQQQVHADRRAVEDEQGAAQQDGDAAAHWPASYSRGADAALESLAEPTLIGDLSYRQKKAAPEARREEETSG